jgi:hypothetical protein
MLSTNTSAIASILDKFEELDKTLTYCLHLEQIVKPLQLLQVNNPTKCGMA